MGFDVLENIKRTTVSRAEWVGDRNGQIRNREPGCIGPCSYWMSFGLGAFGEGRDVF